MSQQHYYYVHQKYLQSLREEENKNRLDRINKIIVAMVVCMIVFNVSLVGSRYFTPPKIMSSQPDVQGAETQKIVIPIALQPSPTPSLSPITQITPTSLTPTPSIILKKQKYSIAIIGDSMVDTMGERLEYLEHALTKKYPGVNFTLYNYGQGGQNVIEGLARFSENFQNRDRTYPSLAEVHPDIMIVGSFGYNPLSPFDRDEHWLKLAELIQQAKTVSSQVYILAEIAPLRADFGKGPNGIVWEEGNRIEQSKKISQQLENAVGLSRSLKIPIIDTYTPSMKDGTKEGDKKYVNPSDGIHPSIEGHEFMVDKIVETIKIDK